MPRRKRKEKKCGIKILRIPKNDEDENYLKQLGEILDEIYNRATVTFDWSWDALAKKAEVSPETVYNLGNRVTKLPRLRTIIKLGNAVGLQIRFVLPEVKRKIKKAG